MTEIVVVCEHREDGELATLLADRVLVEKGPDWLQDSLEVIRRWCGFPVSEPAARFVTWPQLKHLFPKPVRALGYRNHGWDAEACQKAIIAAEQQSRDCAVVALLLVRDLDSEPRRRQVLDAVRKERPPVFAVVLATPNPEMEAWLFHGFEPEDGDEEQRLEQLRRRLPFDPITEPHLFTKKQDIKKALTQVAGESWFRRLACLRSPSLESLKEKGRGSHLADYLQEIEEHLLPALLGDAAYNLRTSAGQPRPRE